MLCDYLVMVQSDLTVRKKICFSRVKITGMKAMYLFVHKTEHDPTHEHTK